MALAHLFGPYMVQNNHDQTPPHGTKHPYFAAKITHFFDTTKKSLPK